MITKRRRRRSRPEGSIRFLRRVIHPGELNAPSDTNSSGAPEIRRNKAFMNLEKEQLADISHTVTGDGHEPGSERR